MYLLVLTFLILVICVILSHQHHIQMTSGFSVDDYNHERNR